MATMQALPRVCTWPAASAPRPCRTCRTATRTCLRVARPALRAPTLSCRAEAPGGGDRGSSGSSSPPPSSPSVEETTRKWGLEAGLWKVFTSKESADGTEPSRGEKMSQAKDLLKRYGSAYLITSISLSIVSFSLSYILISAGVDVAAVLEKIGITVTSTSEQVGVFALAYAVHKAASPIRFPPTVALTPLVARWMGKEVPKE